MGLTTIALAAAGAPAAHATTRVPDRAFQAAAARHHVPAEVLLAIGQVNTHRRMPAGPALDGGWGTMHLTPAQVRRMAHRLHRSRRALRHDAHANLDAGAALLAAAHRSHAGWRAALVRMGGRAFADAVLAQMGVRRAGASQTTPGEEAGTVWVPASSANYTAAARPYDEPIDTIVIHETQGSYASAVSWFGNRSAQASAHFVIRSSDGAITQMVHEHDVAWHAGNRDVNHRSIGIEHEGYVGDCTWNTDAMYQSSARLVAALAVKYHIPIDRAHIIGHSEVPDPYRAGRYGGADGHTDPGSCWNWAYYMGLVASYAGSVPPPAPASIASIPGWPGYQQVVDNGTQSRFRHSNAWAKSRVNRKAYLRGYFFTTPRPKADAARFKIRVPSTGDYTVYARWPASRSYNSRVPVAIHTVTGVKFAYVNQRHHGGRWRKLGTYLLPEGDSWGVEFSRWTKARGTIVADAVKIKAAP